MLPENLYTLLKESFMLVVLSEVILYFSTVISQVLWTK